MSLNRKKLANIIVSTNQNITIILVEKRNPTTTVDKFDVFLIQYQSGSQPIVCVSQSQLSFFIISLPKSISIIFVNSTRPPHKFYHIYCCISQHHIYFFYFVGCP
eukprot:TRINITY_DN14852_c0_g1_i1.p1 TRINITY_DN14852_c0_g1~~TRINITY_DN14852_c0_g1_i1.p1  ORF type:complete len:105 (+),score=16.18 TRINITY_DN14852_c0_g1_i1:117-431(+)